MAIADFDRAREQAENWAGARNYKGLVWEEFTNPLLGHTRNLRGTAEIDGKPTKVFDIMAMKLVLGPAKSRR
ncbi:hypothetical protein ACWCP8_32420 [Streptomyces sp. NPDC002206]